MSNEEQDEQPDFNRCQAFIDKSALKEEADRLRAMLDLAEQIRIANILHLLETQHPAYGYEELSAALDNPLTRRALGVEE